MKQQKKLLSSLVGMFAALTFSSISLASDLPVDNRLSVWADYGTESVDFSNVDIVYKNGKRTNRRSRRDNKYTYNDSKFYAHSTEDSTFNLNGPGDRGTEFNGSLHVHASINRKGRLRESSYFAIYSSDDKFFTDTSSMSHDGEYLVYGGDLTAFGWSGTEGIMEFETVNLEGWALDMVNRRSIHSKGAHHV